MNQTMSFRRWCVWVVVAVILAYGAVVSLVYTVQALWGAVFLMAPELLSVAALAGAMAVGYTYLTVLAKQLLVR